MINCEERNEKKNQRSTQQRPFVCECNIMYFLFNSIQFSSVHPHVLPINVLQKHVSKQVKYSKTGFDKENDIVTMCSAEFNTLPGGCILHTQYKLPTGRTFTIHAIFLLVKQGVSGTSCDTESTGDATKASYLLTDIQYGVLVPLQRHKCHCYILS